MMSKKTQCNLSLCLIFSLITTTFTPLKTTAIASSSVNITWVCDISESAETLENAYNLFTGLFDDIADKNSKVIVINGYAERPLVRPWIDNTTYDFGGQANVVGAFHQAKELLLPVLNESEEQIQLIVFSDLFQSVSVNEARGAVSNIPHADKANIEHAQRLLDEDLSELKQYSQNGQLSVHVIQWACADCAELSYSPLTLPKWVNSYNIGSIQGDFEDKFCEVIGELYARILTGSKIKWQKWNGNSDINNAEQLLIFDKSKPISFENSRNRDWGKLRVVEFADNLENGIKYIEIPAVEWEVDINNFNGTMPVTRNSGVSISAAPLNAEVAARFNQDLQGEGFGATFHYWNSDDVNGSVSLSWTGEEFTGQQLGDEHLLEVGEYFWELYTNIELSETEDLAASGRFTVENLTPVSRPNENTTLADSLSSINISNGNIVINLDDYHSDPDDDDLWYAVRLISGDDNLKFSLSGERSEILTLSGRKPGTAQIEIIARDRKDENDSYVQIFNRTYEIDFHGKRAVIWIYMLIIGLIFLITAVIMAFIMKRKRLKRKPKRK